MQIPTTMTLSAPLAIIYNKFLFFLIRLKRKLSETFPSVLEPREVTVARPIPIHFCPYIQKEFTYLAVSPHLRSCLPRRKRKRPSLRQRRLLQTRRVFAPIFDPRDLTDASLSDLWHEKCKPTKAYPLHLSIAVIVSPYH